MKIHFAHANGIPSASYQPIFDRLSSHQFIHVPKFGHSPHFSVTHNWRYLADELIDFVQKNSQEPVVAIGHSMGALLSYIAACKQPERFRGVLMLDPPLFWGRMCWVLKLAKLTRQMDRIMPSGKSKFRRQHWNSRQAAYEYFAGKPLFQFESECFDAFVEAALKPCGESGVALDFQVEVELEVFRNAPDNLNRYTRPKNLPMKVVYADRSSASKSQFIEPFCRENRISCEKIRGEHMFPLQQPALAAQLISTFLSEL